ncbi:Chromate resistance protein ChrB [Hoeflea sp. AS60]|uniref:Chromate resistance protein ChrB n=1 Tax=Hoeflea sp. AS60 TaxID=3135780 RepID=UPI00316FB1FC
MRQLKMLENDAIEMGGETVLLVTTSLDKAQEGKVIARFKADRDEQYREFIGKCDAFEAEIAREIAKEKFTYAELEEEDNDLKKLQSWIEKIRSLDFYKAILAASAWRTLDALRSRVGRLLSDVSVHPASTIRATQTAIAKIAVVSTTIPII